MVGIMERKASELGLKIKEKRLELGLSRPQLSKMMGWSANRIYEFESGYRNPKIETFNKIMDVMK